jgi:diguanylate cyclase (GGDEF)-like protein
MAILLVVVPPGRRATLARLSGRYKRALAGAADKRHGCPGECHHECHTHPRHGRRMVFAAGPIVVESSVLQCAPMPPVFTSESEPGWFRWLSRMVMRLGLVRATAVLTGVVALSSIGLSELVIIVIGRGNLVLAACIATLCSLVITPVVGSCVLRLVFELDRARQRLTVLATHDDLTGIYNRRHFMSVVQREWDRARRYNTEAAMLLIDADHFKQVNDGHGHLCGDELLRSIAKAVGDSLRQADVLARFGGEELIVFLPHTDPLGALDVAERVRERVAALSVPWRGTTVSTTVSVGVAPLRNELPSLDWMIHEADTALYAAKADGRNCVRTLPFEPSRSGGAFPVNTPR